MKKQTVSEADAALAEKWAAQIAERIVSEALALIERQKVSIRDGADAALSTPGLSHLNEELARIAGKPLDVEALARLVADRLDAPKPVEAKPAPSTEATLKAVAEVDALLDAELKPVADLLVADGMSKTRAQAEALRLVPAAWSAHKAALQALSEGASLASLRVDSMRRADRVARLAGVVKAASRPGSYSKALRETLA